MKRNLKTMAIVVFVIILSVWIIDKIPFKAKIDMQVEPTIYMEGKFVDKTTVTIKGEKTRYLFRDDSVQQIGISLIGLFIFLQFDMFNDGVCGVVDNNSFVLCNHPDITIKTREHSLWSSPFVYKFLSGTSFELTQNEFFVFFTQLQLLIYKFFVWDFCFGIDKVYCKSNYHKNSNHNYCNNFLFHTITLLCQIQVCLRFLYKGIIINHNKKLSQTTLKRRFFKKKAAFFSWPGLGKEWC